MPGDASWPSQNEWDNLNSTVNGRLIATKPIAFSCHEPNYDETECTRARELWTWPMPHSENSASVMNPYFLNQSCDPFTDSSKPCLNGNLPEYAINISSAADVAAGLKFAEKNNIRVIIKNTGHDFVGRSSGAGALSIWTHNLKELEFLDYESKLYTGRAAKIGAGRQAYEILPAANEAGVRVLAGWCPTVGIVGGYTQGGGHGPLIGEYGLAADQTLEWEVVTALGEHLVATPYENSDLYWALSGGGGGTYAVVLSMTTKAHPEGLMGGGNLTLTTSGNSIDVFWQAVDLWNAFLPKVVDEGIQSTYMLTDEIFSIYSMTWSGHTGEELKSLLEPFISQLDQLHIIYQFEYTSFPRFYDHYTHYTPGLPYGDYEISELTGGRLIPRSIVESEDTNSGFTATLRNITVGGRFVLNCVASNVAHSRVGNKPESNAVLPAWRTSIMSIIIVVLWDPRAAIEEGIASAYEMTDEIVPQLERITPGSGTYINEGDFRLKTWKVDYFGINYEMLREVKRKYDPNDLFYAVVSVGSDEWSVAGDGRLCRASNVTE
ncbi:putative fad binding domain protein [Botrytis fragariae]|uniref:Putative fad binding domain protein n=1 Tax=Botrytis fragariae TaxID=1964551 RepID=A0A8H6AY73_9HELO|nr:putative fad binding domain protein [Botrytis fragariae]KAF5875951.1 putative fad binding domain protein [Botrytis fragariae]